MLKDAEKRWEVINIDLDSDDDESTQKNEGSNKRRKVSLSPQGNNESTATGNNATSTTAISQTNSNTNNTTGIRRSGETMLLGQPPNRNTTGNIAGHTTTNNNNYGRAGSQSTTSASTTASSSTVNQIRVEGCGISEVNGIYLPTTNRPSNGFSKYSKTGIWEGKLVIVYKLCDPSGQGLGPIQSRSESTSYMLTHKQQSKCCYRNRQSFSSCESGRISW